MIISAVQDDKRASKIFITAKAGLEEQMTLTSPWSEGLSLFLQAVDIPTHSSPWNPPSFKTIGKESTDKAPVPEACLVFNNKLNFRTFYFDHLYMVSNFLVNSRQGWQNK